MREQDRPDHLRVLPRVRQERAEAVLRRLIGDVQVVAEIRREPRRAREDRQREPGHDLVRAQRDDEERVDERHRPAGDRGDEDREQQRVGALHGPEAHHRADEHHPLDAEVEHAGALGEQLTERGVEQRRSVGDRRREHDDQDRVVDPAGREERHAVPPTAAPCARTARGSA